jgi:hypothetical protein
MSMCPVGLALPLTLRPELPSSKIGTAPMVTVEL